MAGCEAVFIMVNTFEQVKDVVLGQKGIGPACRGERPVRLIVMSTLSPTKIRFLADSLKGRMEILDAPVSGGPILAREGRLSMMIGGDREVLDFVKPYLLSMGKSIFYLGPLGSGMAMKLINNILTLTTLYLVPEALRLGLKGGLDMRTMVEVIRASTGNNWHFDHWKTYVSFLSMFLEDPRNHESLKQISIKDIQTALEWAEELQYNAPVLAGAFSMIKAGKESTGFITQDLFDQMKKAAIE
jgi:3-hydroxyisobutyrate dehydrogenase-like beta-hydroxyacid dehydrogenase